MNQQFFEDAPLKSPPSSFAVETFVKEEDGVMTIFTLFLLFMMLMVAGIGVDLMHNEMRRTSLQNTVDRAVLAAADLDQSRDPEAVVRDYFEKAGLGDFVTSVEPDVQLNMRNVSATAYLESPTQFMRLLGVNALPVPAASRAIEDVPNVEISLVLDVSGSMRFNNRMDNLRPAAGNFIDIVLTGAAVDNTSINLIPYAGQTNPGPVMFDRLNGRRLNAAPLDEVEGGILEALSHSQLAADETAGIGSVSGGRYVFPNVSSCMELTADDFNNVGLPDNNTYRQTPHFLHFAFPTETIRDADGNEILFDEFDEPTTNGIGRPSGVMNWGWCPYDSNDIIYASNNATVLKNRINTMRMYDGTGTHYAMKWATALLDPATQPDFEALSQPVHQLVEPAFANRPLPYDAPETTKYIILMTDGQITNQFRPQWPLNPLNPKKDPLERNHLLARPESQRETISNANENFNRFKSICDLAKQPERNIVIYTIAFEAPGVPEQEMRECSSGDGFFFRASGQDEINDAFSSIARQINELRLTQ